MCGGVLGGCWAGGRHRGGGSRWRYGDRGLLDWGRVVRLQGSELLAIHVQTLLQGAIRGLVNGLLVLGNVVQEVLLTPEAKIARITLILEHLQMHPHHMLSHVALHSEPGKQEKCRKNWAAVLLPNGVEWYKKFPQFFIQIFTLIFSNGNTTMRVWFPISWFPKYHQWFSLLLGSKQVTSPYLNQFWTRPMLHMASLGLNSITAVWISSNKFQIYLI